MKIQFVKSPAGIGYAYFAGDVLVCEKPFGKEMMELGYAIEIEEPADGDLPPDFPSRQTLVKLGVTLDEVKKLDSVEQLVALNGIGEASAKKIIEYLKAAE